MLKNQCLLLSVLAVVSQAGFAASRFDSLDFYPKVEIFRPTTSEALEIVLEKKNYQAEYNHTLSRFHPIGMKFDVVSKLSTKIDYELKLSLSSHHCQNIGDESSEAELLGVELTLDGYDFKVDQELKGNPYSTSSTRTHHMTLNSPEIRMTSEEQVCYGVVGVSAVLSEGSI